ncbi:polysaccharide pyruvyl transferase family protein [Acinetobacter radioresistens]|uniref:polysaccharide pyruvyl transferase family protein n=1 Tax=Acinetobacter radioresistens TaxID=40216 RepID=UPI000E712660|nr:polysaccharide pyruvyl transferase family protein [Acinetobacter radioresistens]RJL75178.1 polysaccharide pyruvyl transferase family protein [Acinetobacter radioresistens]
MNKKRIVVAGEVFSSNLGDYAIFDSLSKILKSKDIDVIPLDISFRKDLPNINKDVSLSSKNTKIWNRGLLKNIKNIKLVQYLTSRFLWYFLIKEKTDKYWESIIQNSDGVIIGGGQLITDNTSFFYPKLNKIVEIAQRNNKPFAIIGCGVGENIGSYARKIYKNILNEAKYVSFRDNGSVKKIKAYLDHDISLHVYPDLAFALKDPVLTNITLSQNILCGFNIIPLSFFKKFDSSLKDVNEAEYLLFWKRLAQGAINAGMKIALMTNGNPGDHEQAKIVYQSLLANNIDVSLFDRPKQPNELYMQIHMVDYLVAMRMHAGIIAQAFGKNVATLAWDQKIPDVWNAIGSADIVIDSSILKDENPWNRVEKSFEHSRILSVSSGDLESKVNENVDECLKVMI